MSFRAFCDDKLELRVDRGLLRLGRGWAPGRAALSGPAATEAPIPLGPCHAAVIILVILSMMIGNALNQRIATQTAPGAPPPRVMTDPASRPPRPGSPGMPGATGYAISWLLDQTHLCQAIQKQFQAAARAFFKLYNRQERFKKQDSGHSKPFQ